MISPHPSYSMLYRTQNHLPLAFKPPPPHSSPSLSPHLLSTTIYSKGMELPEPKFEDMTSEEMFVDELLDFSSGFSEPENEPEVQNNNSSSVSLVTQEQTLIQKQSLCGKDAFAPMPEPELALPEEGLESLEWLSHFVEDSFSEYSLTGKPPPKPLEKRPQPAVSLQNTSRFAKKARTKRARTGIRVWPVLSSDYGSSSPSSSTSSTTTTSFPPPNYWAHSEALFLPVSIVAKRKAPAADGGGAAAGQPRRCTHCGVTKTPQWRAGPLGSKTLCNACGVRFKSGRLLPEYRPACSPTFSSELHSNNHRKVLEMRRQKEVEVPVSGPVQG